MPDLVIQKKIDAIIADSIDQKQLVGASVGVQMEDEVLVSCGYGYADLSQQTKATENTVYRIGSMTKQFTALAVMMLVEQGRINLSDDMVDYLPDYQSWEYSVTIEQLLNHTSGIKSYTDIKRFWEVSHKNLSREDVVALFASEPFEFSPGENFQYNNSGYYLLGLIIEHVSGMSYADFLRELVWHPLEMFDTHYLGSAEDINNLATGYDYKENEFVRAAPLGMENPFAGGSLGSSVSDLLKWQVALNEHQLIPQKSYEKMIRPSILNDGTKTTYGYGFFLSNLDGHHKIEHGGDINGFRAQLSYYPDDDLAVVVLCNLYAAPRAQLESRIARSILGIPEIDVEDVVLSEEELQIYTGTYKWCSFKAPLPFSVSVINGQLHSGKRPMRAIGKHRFVFADDPYWNVSFTIEKGKAVGFLAQREGQETEAVCIENC